ncbi:MAG: DUF4296 domain-containing protein [Bacteroidales bacterium]
MLYRNIIFGFLTLSLFSIANCTSNDNQLIERDKFVKILTDLQIAEGIMSTKGLFDGSLNNPEKSYYNFVLKKYNVSRSQFDYSLEYYDRNQNELLKMFEEVIENLQKRIPKKLSPNSIYIIADKIKEEARKTIDPSLRFGPTGYELWQQKNIFNFPGDTAIDQLTMNKEIKYQSLIVFKAEFKSLAKNKTKKPVMKFFIQYNDSTSDTIEQKLTLKTNEWQDYHIVYKTDSLKTPVRLKSSVIDPKSIDNNTYINIRSVSLRLYVRNRDTSDLFSRKTIPLKDKPLGKKGKPVPNTSLVK